MATIIYPIERIVFDSPMGDTRAYDAVISENTGPAQLVLHSTYSRRALKRMCLSISETNILGSLLACVCVCEFRGMGLFFLEQGSPLTGPLIFRVSYIVTRVSNGINLCSCRYRSNLRPPVTRVDINWPYYIIYIYII